MSVRSYEQLGINLLVAAATTIGASGPMQPPPGEDSPILNQPAITESMVSHHLYLPAVERAPEIPTEFFVSTAQEFLDAVESINSAPGGVDRFIRVTEDLDFRETLNTEVNRPPEFVSIDPNLHLTDSRALRVPIAFDYPGTVVVDFQGHTASFSSDNDGIIFSLGPLQVLNGVLQRNGVEASAEGLSLVSRYLITAERLIITNTSISNTTSLASGLQHITLTQPNETNSQPQATEVHPDLVGGLKAVHGMAAVNVTVTGLGWDGFITGGNLFLEGCIAARDPQVATGNNANHAGAAYAAYPNISSSTMAQTFFDAFKPESLPSAMRKMLERARSSASEQASIEIMGCTFRNYYKGGIVIVSSNPDATVRILLTNVDYVFDQVADQLAMWYLLSYYGEGELPAADISFDNTRVLESSDGVLSHGKLYQILHGALRDDGSSLKLAGPGYIFDATHDPFTQQLLSGLIATAWFPPEKLVHASDLEFARVIYDSNTHFIINGAEWTAAQIEVLLAMIGIQEIDMRNIDEYQKIIEDIFGNKFPNNRNLTKEDIREQIAESQRRTERNETFYPLPSTILANGN